MLPAYYCRQEAFGALYFCICWAHILSHWIFPDFRTSRARFYASFFVSFSFFIKTEENPPGELRDLVKSVLYLVVRNVHTFHPIEITLFQFFRKKEAKDICQKKSMQGTPSRKSEPFRCFENSDRLSLITMYYLVYMYLEKNVPWCWGKSGKKVCTDYYTR